MVVSQYLKFSLLICALTQLVACTATHTAVSKNNLDVQTKMSASIFLDPVTSDKRTVYLQVRNTSDKCMEELECRIAEALSNKGYRVVRALEQAHYLLQANILQVGRNDLRATQHALDGGFGATLGGAVVGAGVGSLAAGHGHRDEAAIVGGLVGATVATVANAMIQDVVYSVVADIQISERVSNATLVKEKTKSKLKQGTGSKEITSTEKTGWKRYQTRVVSTANKVNLKFERAEPELVTGLTRSIAGIF